ncbi:MAG: tetratricopeptide repeat protein [Pleurocapsa sp.]
MNNRDSEFKILQEQKSNSLERPSPTYPVHSSQLQVTLANSAATPLANQDSSLSKSSSALTRQTMSKSVEIQPNSEIANIYVKQASVYFQEGNWQQTIDACKRALQTAPHTAEAYKLWGNVLQRLGNKSEALGCYARALEIQPDLAEVYANLGSFHAEQAEWQQAIAYYEKAVTVNPNLAGAYRNLAKIWEELGDSHRALRCFCQAINLEPKTLTAAEYIGFADELYQQGKLQEASIFYIHGVNADPNCEPGYIKLVEILETIGQWQEAVVYYRQLIALQKARQNSNVAPQPRLANKPISNLLANSKKKAVKSEKQLPPALLPPSLPPKKSDSLPESTASQITGNNSLVDNPQESSLIEVQPESAQSWNNLGSLYAQKQQWQKAISCYQKALELDVNFSHTYHNLAKVYDQLGEQQKATAYLYKALTLNPSGVSAEDKFQLGRALLSQGNQSAALSCLRQALQLKPDYADAYVLLGEIFYNKQRESEAQTCYAQAVKYQTNNSLAYFRLGQIAAKQQNDKQAFNFYKQAIALEPEHPEAYHYLGEILDRQERWGEAIKVYRQAIKFNPDFSWSYNNLGYAYLQQKQYHQAIEAYRQAIKLNPEFFWSYQNLGTALDGLERWSKSIAIYETAIELNPNFYWSHYNLGEAYGKTGEWSKAIAAYEQAIALNPDFAEAYGHLGDALIANGDYPRAIAAYEQAIKIDPGADVSVYKNLGEALIRRKQLEQIAAESEDSSKTEIATETKPSWPYYSVDSTVYPPTLPDSSPWPKISIVTPSFNQGEFIEETILSVINQNYPSLEYILIDGGSTDDTMQIVERYREYFSYIVSEPDGGQSNALNKGFTQATGEIFTWLNSDDRLAPGALYAVALAFHTSGADLVAGVCQLFQDGIEVEQHLTSCANGQLPLDDLLDLENCWLKGKFFYQPEVMFTRAIWQQAGGSIDETLYYSMDYELWVRFAAQNAQIHVIGCPIAQYRMHPAQKTNTIEQYKPELSQTRDALQQRLNLPVIDLDRPSLSTWGRKNLRVVFLNDTGSLGGAGIAHQRIARAFSLAGHQVIPVAGTMDWSLTPVNCQVDEVYQIIASISPDLLVIGNLHNFKHPLEILAKLTAHFPTVFVMHDQWLLTGRCAYTGNCQQYQTLCDRDCPTSDEYPSLPPEQIASTFEQKYDLLANTDNLLVLGDSNWITNWARDVVANHDRLADSQSIRTQFYPIYYGLDIEVFQPQDKLECRRLLGLPEDKFIIITGSQSLEDKRKGFTYLLQALEIASLGNLLVISFGHDRAIETSLDLRSTGYINNSALLACYYSAADMFVGASQEEAFGQTFIEAAACGTPAIGYKVGGVPEAICDGVSGLIANCQTPEALAEKIAELYYHRDRLELLSKTAPLYIANHFSCHSSYHSLITAFDQSGWLEKLQIAPVSKFTSHTPTQIEPLSVKTGILQPQQDIVDGQNVKCCILQGFDILEPPYPDIGLLHPNRWLLHPGGRLAIISDFKQRGRLKITCRNISLGQSLQLFEKDKLLWESSVGNSNIKIPNIFTVPILLQEGINFFEIKADKYTEDKQNRRLAVLMENINFTSASALKSSSELDIATEKSILMNENFYGSGWFTAETLEGLPVRWMKKTSSIIINEINTTAPLEVKIFGVTATNPQFLTEMKVKINGSYEVKGEVKQQFDCSWMFRGIIPADVLGLSSPFVLSIEAPDVAQLAPNDTRYGSLLIREIFLKSLQN